MKTKFLIILTFALATVPAFANETSTPESSDRSPLFLRTAEPGVPAVDQQAWNDATPLPTDRRAFLLKSKLTFAVAQENEGGADADATSATVGETKNPGRALLLSAILPGAGELYAGSKLKASFFFALELACWYGAVTYALRGDAKQVDYQDYVEKNWREDYYRSVEYTAAQDPLYPLQNPTAFSGTSSEWANLSWQEKIAYLPDNFTHELASEHNQSYYENVGKYLTQFGYGWNDWIAGRTTDVIDAWAAANGYNWLKGGGVSPLANRYEDLRYESNQLLDRSAAFFSIIMVNHVISALDAGFTVRLHNRKLARVEPTTSQIRYNHQPVATAGLAVRF